MAKLVALVLKVPQQEIARDKTPGESNSKHAKKRLETLIY